jgi:hypothetical protein
MRRKINITLLTVFLAAGLQLQAAAKSDDQTRQELDLEYIAEVENPNNETTDKVLHAEPLYIDLIRDLGARAGELEVNLGYGVQDKREFAKFEYLAEIEWAPINRLGIELELPFSHRIILLLLTAELFALGGAVANGLQLIRCQQAGQTGTPQAFAIFAG